MDEFRKKSFEELPEELAGMPPESQWVENLELSMALKELEPRERELVFVRIVNEVPMADLAKIYGKSRFVLRREISKILKKLERRMADGTELRKAVETDLSRPKART